jgi:hypothetical protein
MNKRVRRVHWPRSPGQEALRLVGLHRYAIGGTVAGAPCRLPPTKAAGKPTTDRPWSLEVL